MPREHQKQQRFGRCLTRESSWTKQMSTPNRTTTDFSFKISWKYPTFKSIRQPRNASQPIQVRSGSACSHSTTMSSSKSQYSPSNRCTTRGRFPTSSVSTAKMEPLSSRAIPLRWLLSKDTMLGLRLSWSRLERTSKADTGLQRAPTTSTVQVELTKTLILKCQRAAFTLYPIVWMSGLSKRLFPMRTWMRGTGQAISHAQDCLHKIIWLRNDSNLK